jgi:hypothetical protein
MYMPITVFSKETKENFVFSHINFVFGYAKSGKTTILSDLSNILSGKDKHHLVNGTQAMPNDFNILSLSSADGISAHLKLNSKSLLRRLIQENKYSPSFSSSCNQIQKGIASARMEIEEKIRSVLPGTKIDISDSESPLDFLMDNMSIVLESDTSSDEKGKLFSIVNCLAQSTACQTVVIIDDFDKDFDEEMTLNFLKEIQETNACFILSTKKNIPQIFLDENASIFAVRDERLIELPPLPRLIETSLTKNQNFATFEEYMTGQGYLETSGLEEMYLSQVQNDEKNNIVRILTSHHPVINALPQAGKVTICPRSAIEAQIYQNIFSLLGIPLDEK